MTPTPDQATPRPWKVADDGKTIEAYFEGEQLTLLQGGHITWCSEPGASEKTQRYRAMTKKAIREAVRAVNERDGLLAQNQAMREALKVTLDALYNETQDHPNTPWIVSVKGKAHAALAVGKE